MTDPSNDYANGEASPTLEDLEQRSRQLSDLWSEELDLDVHVTFELSRGEWILEIAAAEHGCYPTEAALTDALSTLLNA